MNFGYIVDGMTYLKYYMPLVEEASSRGIKSTFIISRCGKYNCPYEKNHFSLLQKISLDYGVELLQNHDKKVVDSLNYVFTVEGTKASILDQKKIISLCCSTDFNASYENYVNKVNYVVMSSKFVSEHYQKISDKNLYLGTPKFDVKLDPTSIRKKYGLNYNDKYVTIFYPRLRDHDKAPLKKIMSDLHMLGYKVILKTRGKDPVMPSDSTISDLSLEDLSWHPHTSLELIVVSDFIINFSSSVIEETTALNKPMINFHVKPFVKPFDFLYDFSFVENMNVDYTTSDFQEAVKRITLTKLSASFEEANKKLLDTKTSSKDIVDLLT